MNFLQIILSATVWLFTIIFIVAFRYDNFNISQIDFSDEKSQKPEIKRIVKSVHGYMIVLALAYSGLTFLGKLDFIRPRIEAYYLILFFIFLISAWLLIHYGQKKLNRLKETHTLKDKSENIIAIDTKATRRQGKDAPSVRYAWLIWSLNFIPLLFLLFRKNPDALPMIGIVPLVFIVIPLMYSRAVHYRQKVLFKDSKINQMYAAESEKLAGQSLLMVQALCTLSYLLIAINFYFFLTNQTMFFIVIPLLFIGTIVILLVNQKRRSQLIEKLKDNKIIHSNQVGTYKWGFYYDRNDSRIFVPKMLGGMGTTINIGRPVGKALALGTLLLVIVIIGLIMFMTLINFNFDLAETFKVNIPFYSTKISPEDVETISLSTAELNGTRTNGVGGINRSFGYFVFSGYGKTRTYLNNDVNEKIIIKLKNDDRFSYMILNEENKAKTLNLYQDLQEWFRKP